MPAAVTVEMPFKDVATNPDRFHGWSPERAQHFGAASLQAVHAVLCRMQQLDREEETLAGQEQLRLGGKHEGAAAAAVEHPDKRQRTEQ